MRYGNSVGATKAIIRPSGDQLSSNAAFAPELDTAFTALQSLEHGEHVDAAKFDPTLQKLFAPQVQDFLIDMFRQDPAKLAASVKLPLLIVQGERDVQVSTSDAKTLAAAQPKAKLVLLPSMNHVLKDVSSYDREANVATYTDASLPVDSGLVDAVVKFVKR